MGTLHYEHMWGNLSIYPFIQQLFEYPLCQAIEEMGKTEWRLHMDPDSQLGCVSTRRLFGDWVTGIYDNKLQGQVLGSSEKDLVSET